ncbi:MAG TPA: PhzF family phenazine biosynthesis protein [Candidatus Eisenbacteria bacterium]|nr:PhzF family phenazine biosynthesis protein [Candidatus Eisenbacteria bacterium]
MRIPYWHLDAFAEGPLLGNPAGVCMLEAWLDPPAMQRIAAENALPETAFVVRERDRWGIRWFSPAVEIDLCGHATLASGHVVLTHREPDAEAVTFHSPGGALTVRRAGARYALDLPARPAQPIAAPPALAAALGARPREVLAARDWLVVLEREDDVRNLAPDLARIARLPPFAVCVTAPGREVEFVSRFFAPRQGIPEDPVTGSAHCTLAPYWAARLGRTRMRARQLSPRGGALDVTLAGERVILEGGVRAYIEGTLTP